MKKKVMSILALIMVATIGLTLVGCNNRVESLCCFDGANVIRYGGQEEYRMLSFEQRSANLTIGNQLNAKHTTRYRDMDEFAGVWFCRYGHLNIALTRVVADNDRVTGIIYHQHRFTHAFLEKIHDALIEIFSWYSLSASGVRERTNVLEIELLADGEEACKYIRNIAAHLQLRGVWERDAVLFIIGAPQNVLLDARILLG